MSVATRTSRPLRRGAIVAAWVVGGVVAYALVVWLLRPNIEGALLGPLGPLVAFLVGAVAFFSPCVLPLVPGYLSFVSGLSGDEMNAPGGRRRVLLGVGLFVLGFAAMFTAMGMVLTSVSARLLEDQEDIARFGGVLVAVLGVAMLAPAALPFLERERRPLLSRVKPGLIGAAPLGAAFAIGWSPCVGPGMGVIYTIGINETSARAALLYFSFCLGFGLWFLLSALGVRRILGATAWMRKRARLVQGIAGGLMVAIGVLLALNVWEVVIGPLRRLTDSFATPL